MTAHRRERAGAAEQRGFTLIELVVYLALVTGGLAVLLGLELAASRAWFLEHALIELALHGDELGMRFRDDVRQATNLSVPAPVAATEPHGTVVLLVATLASGQTVVWELEDATSVEAVNDVERHAAGVRAASGRLVRTLKSASGAETKDRAVWSGVEKLEVVRVLVGGRAAVELDLGLVVTRGREVSARRHFHVGASPIAAGGAP